MCQLLRVCEEDPLFCSREPGRNDKKGCKQFVLLVEERRWHVKGPGQTLPHRKMRQMLASFVLVDAGTRREFVDSRVNAELLLGQARADPCLFQALGKNGGCRVLIRHPLSFWESLAIFTKSFLGLFLKNSSPEGVGAEMWFVGRLHERGRPLRRREKEDLLI